MREEMIRVSRGRPVPENGLFQQLKGGKRGTIGRWRSFKRSWRRGFSFQERGGPASLSSSPLQFSLPPLSLTLSLSLSCKLYLAAGRFTTFGGAINRATRTDLYIDIGALKYTNVPLIGLSPPVRTIKAALHSPPKSLLTAAPFKLEIWPLKVATIHRAYRTHRPPREKLFLQTGVRNDSPVFAVDLAEAVSDTGVERAIKSLNVFIGPSLVNADPGKNSWTRSE